MYKSKYVLAWRHIACPGAGFIGIPRKIMALKNLKAIIIDLNYIKGILFFLDLTGE